MGKQAQADRWQRPSNKKDSGVGCDLMCISSASLESRPSASSYYSHPAAKELPRGPTKMMWLLLRTALLSDSVVLGVRGSPDLSSWKATSQQPRA